MESHTSRKGKGQSKNQQNRKSLAVSTLSTSHKNNHKKESPETERNALTQKA
jgi:hypothetical protein